MEPRTEQPENRSVLVADGDDASLRVLEVSLRSAGFDVHAVRDGAAAAAWLDDHVPLLVVADTSLGGLDGFELCRRIKNGAGHTTAPVLLIGETTIENKVQAVKAGAEELLSKPVHVKDLMGRVSLLMRRREWEQLRTAADGQTRFSGDLVDMSIVDLLQAIENSRRSGVIELTNRQNARAEIYFRQGAVIDAEVGRLSGREAMFRLFSWSEGRFQIEFKGIRRKDTVEMPSRALVIEGMGRLDEWTHLVAGLPPLSTVFDVDYRLLADRLADIPDEVNGILRLFDGIRSLVQVMDDCDLTDRDAMTIIGRLHHEEIIRDVRLRRRKDDPVRGPDLEGWLTEAAGPFRASVEPVGADGLAAVTESATPDVQGAADAGVVEGTSEEISEEQRDRFTDRLNAEGEPAPAPEVTAFDDFARELASQQQQAASAGAEAPAAIASQPSGSDAIPEVREGDPSVVIPFPALTGDRRETLPPSLLSPELASDIGPARATELGLGPLPMPMDKAVAPSTPVELEQVSLSQVSKRWMDAGDNLSKAQALDELGLPPRFRGVMVVVATVVLVGGGLFAIQRLQGGARPVEIASRTAGPDKPLESPTTSRGKADNSSHGGSSRAADEAGSAATATESQTAAAAAKGGATPPGQAPSARSPGAGSPVNADVRQPPAKAADGVATRGTRSAEGVTGGAATKATNEPAAPAANPADFPRLLADCRRAFEKGRLREATAACTLATDANPDSGEALVLLAHTEFNRNRRKEALAWAEKAIKADPTLADAYVIMGGVQQDTGRSREAKWAYRKYLELAPRGQYAADLRAIVDTL